MSDQTPSRQQLVARAAQWIVGLSGDDSAANARARAGFDAWKRADPRHAEAAARMETLLATLGQPHGEPNGKPNGEPNGRRGRPERAALRAALAPAAARQAGKGRRLAATLGLALLLSGAGWLALQGYSPAMLTADLHSRTGQWRSAVLADGSRITLNSGSALRLHFDAHRRAVELLQGEILLQVAHDAERPFVVDTAEGSIRALGTRFVVRRVGVGTELRMLESRTLVRAAAGTGPGIVVHAGERVTLSAGGVGAVDAIDAVSVADGWQRHQLVVQGQPLAAVLDELARHRRGHLHYDAGQIRNMTVSAVLPLDDTDHALRLLLHSFPALRIRTLSPYLVLVDAPVASALPAREK